MKEQRVKLNQVAVKEAEEFLLAIGDLAPDKAAKQLNKSFGFDRKFNNFIASKFDSGMSLLTNEKTQNSVIEALKTDGKAIDENKVTERSRKHALIIHILTAKAETAVENKRAEMTKQPLNDVQKEQLAKKLAEYREFLMKNVRAGAIQLGKKFGTLTYTEVEVEEEEAEALPELAEEATA